MNWFLLARALLVAAIASTAGVLRPFAELGIVFTVVFGLIVGGLIIVLELRARLG